MNTLIFRKEWRDAVMHLPQDQRCQMYEALFDYAFEGEFPQDDMVKAVIHTWMEHVNVSCLKYVDAANGTKRKRKRRRKGDDAVPEPDNDLTF